MHRAKGFTIIRQLQNWRMFVMIALISTGKIMLHWNAGLIICCLDILGNIWKLGDIMEFGKSASFRYGTAATATKFIASRPSNLCIKTSPKDQQRPREYNPI